MDSTMARLDWQEQILQNVDIDELGEEAYSLLLEELSEAVLWSDTLQNRDFRPRLRQQFILSSSRTLSTRDGYRDPSQERRESNKAYLGDPWHQTLRYRLRLGNEWQAGLCFDKDAGEAWQQGFPLFDSALGFISYQARRKRDAIVQQAIVGHYRLQMGCGLVFNQGFSLGKQYISQQLLQRSNAFRPYASNAEANYMQGAALRLRLGQHFTLLPYASAVQIDGTLTDQHIITSIKTDGLHRTHTEDSRRSVAWQTTVGARAGWRGEWYDMGLHLTTTQLQYNYRRNVLYYNQNYFSGHQLSHASADYQVRALGCLLRGELAMDDHGGLAAFNMLKGNLSSFWHATLIHRYYSSEYHQLQASSLRESSAMQGEQGVTMQVEGSISRHWDVQLMADWFHFSQPQYGVRDSSSDGYEGIARATYTQRKASVAVTYRIKDKGDYMRHSLDTYLSLMPLHSLSFKTQAKLRLHQQDGSSQGFAICQSGTWDCAHFGSPNNTMSLSAQAIYFDTDDYDSRLYMTEKSVLYGFGLPMLYGQGVRYSSTASLHLGTRFVIDLKWAMTNYANRREISSGLQRIASNTQHDLWLQLRMKL